MSKRLSFLCIVILILALVPAASLRSGFCGYDDYDQYFSPVTLSGVDHIRPSVPLRHFLEAAPRPFDYSPSAITSRAPPG
jgi:hypothetical protein